MKHTRRLLVSVRAVGRIQALGATGLVVIFLALQGVKLGLGHDSVLGLVQGFDLLFRASVPAWFASATFGLAAVLAAGVAATEPRGGGRTCWWGLVAFGAFFSAEHATGVGMRLLAGLAGSGADSLALGVPADLLLAALASIAFGGAALGSRTGREWTRALPAAVRRRIALAAALFAGSGIGVRGAVWLQLQTQGWENVLFYALLVTEWALQVASAALVAAASLEQLGHSGGLEVAVRGSSSVPARRSSDREGPA